MWGGGGATKKNGKALFKIKKKKSKREKGVVPIGGVGQIERQTVYTPETGEIGRRLPVEKKKTQKRDAQ